MIRFFASGLGEFSIANGTQAMVKTMLVDLGCGEVELLRYRVSRRFLNDFHARSSSDEPDPFANMV